MNKMSNSNTLPLLYALTPIDQTEGLEEVRDKVFTVIEGVEYCNMKAVSYWDGKKFLCGETEKVTHYLRPLPEGSRVFQQGEVAVSEDELSNLIWEGVNMYGNAMYNIEERVKQFILTKLAQMGE